MWGNMLLFFTESNCSLGLFFMFKNHKKLFILSFSKFNTIGFDFHINWIFLFISSHSDGDFHDDLLTIFVDIWIFSHFKWE